MVGTVIAGKAAHLLADFDLAAQTGAGDDHTMPLQNEGAVYGQPEISGRRGFSLLLERFRDQGFELVDALTGRRGDGELGGILQHRTQRQNIDFFTYFSDPR